MDGWPAGNANGSILITSRDSTVGFGVTATTLQLHPFDNKAGTDAILALTRPNSELESDRSSASKIVEILGGLPLAINQMAGFISQQRLGLDNFLSLYQRNSARINSRKLGGSDYNHTLSTVWEVSLGHLSGPSGVLQKLLAFFDPDGISESILHPPGDWVPGGALVFLEDEME